MDDLQLRAAEAADVPAITALYADEVRRHVNTYEDVAPDQAEMLRRMQDLTTRGYPYLVACTADGRLAGYAYASSYRPRAAYRWTVEDTVYVAPALHGRGVGSALLQALIAACEARGFRQMIAVIGEPGNHASVRLHQRFGFAPVGVFRGLGRKHGRWLDTLQMQRPLGPGADEAPSDE
ncbi:L-amino acid N-acyltransferase YncA [Xanthomonas sacchari]|uniref:GNAT family N-acetyltransferase n=1 Tax=Xanthomonas sacchari TaxID=56458 RepID=UPI00277E97A3|nr:GNAT family N-acetyltransferase [Xanthomonas sacchari]MDQ1093062.1 L-amino acid N-acyltransferase YncA [Xanthomonas sacchari]